MESFNGIKITSNSIRYSNTRKTSLQYCSNILSGYTTKTQYSANNIYLILYLHAAPGGQGSDSAISDYDPDKPSLWESELNRDKAVALWGQLANRYKDEPWMGGYV